MNPHTCKKKFKDLIKKLMTIIMKFKLNKKNLMNSNKNFNNTLKKYKMS